MKPGLEGVELGFLGGGEEDAFREEEALFMDFGLAVELAFLVAEELVLVD